MGDSLTMNTAKTEGRGFHPLYLWGLLYVVLTYAYPVIWFLTIPKVDESVTSDAAYKEFAKAQNGALGSDLPLLVLAVPVLLLLINVIVAISMKNTHRRVMLNASRLIKYLMIPFFIAGAALIALFFLLMFTPLVIMVFVSPIVIGVLAVLGWISLVGSAPFMISYLGKAVRDGKIKKGFATICGFFQFVFVTDVIGTIICTTKEKKSQ